MSKFAGGGVGLAELAGLGLPHRPALAAFIALVVAVVAVILMVAVSVTFSPAAAARWTEFVAAWRSGPPGRSRSP